jgi:predicted acyltransferase
MSLDVFRGATIASMVLVNNPGSWSAAYSPLLHAEWHGWTFTDLIFPFFLWIVGVAIPLSTARRLEQGQSRTELVLHALRRALTLFAIGFALNLFSALIDRSLHSESFPIWLGNVATHVRVPGVLQRIAICYFIASLIFLRAGLRGQVGTVLGLLAGYWLLVGLVPVPGYGAGLLEKDGNLGQYVDNLLLNGPHIGTHVARSERTWDPEGVLSTLPAIATCLFGVLAGRLLRSKLIPEAKTAWLLVAGSLLLFAGTIMNVWLPINKSLWTSSYSVFMAGMAATAFGVCYWLIDVQGWRKWTRPFAIYGMNAITVFVLAGILGRLSIGIYLMNSEGKKVMLKTFLYDKFYLPLASPETAPFFGFLASPKNASLLWALTYVAGLFLVAYVMWRKKWVVKF